MSGHGMGDDSMREMDESAFCNGGGRVMLPGFQFSPDDDSFCIKYLFKAAVVDTQGKYAAAIVATFFLCIALEFLRLGRQRLVQGNLSYVENNFSELGIDILNAFSYMAQVTIAYWIMLLVMLYEAGIFIAIVLGLGTGYFMVLRSKRSMNKNKAQAEDSSPLPSKMAQTPGKHVEDSTLTASSPCCDNA